MSGQQQQERGSIGGGWLGTYAYRGFQQGLPPVRFEAAFTETGSRGRFTGTILDDDGHGEAIVAGVKAGPGVRFFKTYRQGEYEAIEYEGAFADEGRTLQGTWRGRTAHGVWDARRSPEAAHPREAAPAA